MKRLKIVPSLCNSCGECLSSCPFGALTLETGKPAVSAGCRMCGLCASTCKTGALTMAEVASNELDRNAWRGIMVYVEMTMGRIHPVTLELLGEAKKLALKNEPVTCFFPGYKIRDSAKELLSCGADAVYTYDHKELEHFRADVYVNLFEDCIKEYKPSVVLVGATSAGRSLAPRAAARMRTGLTADCTKLERKGNSDLVQIRPAFGGNIMARIVTARSRPQFASVRYKVMETARRTEPRGAVISREVPKSAIQSGIRVLSVEPKTYEPSITDAEVIVVAGRGLKDKKDMALLEELASLIGAQLAGTRSVIEAGWLPYTRQIGLSGRTVKPKLIITCGVSGAIQFTAGMDGSMKIIAINTDKNARIFSIAHHGIVGDIYEVIPELIRKIREGGGLRV